MCFDDEFFFFVFLGQQKQILEMANPSLDQQLLNSIRSIVLKESEDLEGRLEKISGYDFNNGVDYSKILKSLISTGFQASNLGEAIEVVNNMVSILCCVLTFIFNCFWFCVVFHLVSSN